jgi:hypothetical protein
VFPKWRAHARIDTFGGIYSVSCPTAQMCVALGNSSVAFKVTALSWNGLKWKKSRLLPLYSLATISCPTATFCMAVGKGGDGLAHGAAIWWNGKKWSALHNVDTASGVYLTSVSCSSATFCVAGDTQGNVLTWDGVAWSEPVSIDHSQLSTMACPSRAFCATGDSFGRIYMYRNGTWQQAPPITGASLVRSISCSSPKFCAALSLTSQSYAAIWNGSKWTAMKHIDVELTTSVTCPQKNYCVAVDDHGWDTVYNGKSWSKVHRISELLQLYSVSCATKRFCVTTAADSTGYAYWTPLPKPRIVLVDNARRIDHGQTLVFTVTLTGKGRTPTGTVTWTLKGPGTPSCQPSKLKSGKATCKVPNAPRGRYTATAYYSGDPWFRPARAVDHATVT